MNERELLEDAFFRARDWSLDKDRKPAKIAFGVGLERAMAYSIEDYEMVIKETEKRKKYNEYQREYKRMISKSPEKRKKWTEYNTAWKRNKRKSPEYRKKENAQRRAKYVKKRDIATQ
jgi:hypothetical protein